jgi:hypothetical protein
MAFQIGEAVFDKELSVVLTQFAKKPFYALFGFRYMRHVVFG